MSTGDNKPPCRTLAFILNFLLKLHVSLPNHCCTFFKPLKHLANNTFWNTSINH